MSVIIRVRKKLRRFAFFSTLFLLFLGLTSWLSPKIFCRSGAFKGCKNYSPDDYSGQSQNWSILQDKRGIIYAGNHGGVLEFDGVSWKLIDIPNRSVRSMAINDAGTIYIGGKDEIGFLTPDSKGALKYVSLLQHVENSKRNFSNVWSTHATNEGIYFRTSNFLFRWNSGEIKVWEPRDSFKAAAYFKQRFFVQQMKLGLQQMENDSLKLVPGGEIFSEDKIFVMIPYDAEKLLIGTRSKGFYIYDGIQFMPFPTDVDDYLEEKQLYHGIRLSSGDFVLATLRGGLVVMDSHGGLKQIINKSFGLQDDNVKHVFSDSQGNLWLALQEGITKIHCISPVSIYDDRSNLPGMVLSITRHGPHNNLYVGTTNGLYFLASPGPDEFRPVPGMSVMCGAVLSVGDSLLAATLDGVFQIRNNNKKMVSEDFSYALCRSKKEPNRVWVGKAFGLVSLARVNQSGQWQWIEEHKFENITQKINNIVEDQKGNLWLGTETQGVLKVDFPPDGTVEDPVVTRYHKAHGLPPLEINAFMAAGHVIFASPENGIFRFDEKNKAFVPDFTLGAEFADGSNGVFRIVEDKNKNIWFHSNSRNIQAVPQQDGIYVLNKKPFLTMPEIQANAIYPDPDGDIVWFGTQTGLIRYDSTIKKDYHVDFHALIREVLVNGNLVFAGYNNDSKPLFPIIDYMDRRKFGFEFSAPFFEGESAIEYQCLLEGYDEAWSAWNEENQKEYFNLDSGTYTFRVRARNVYQNISREDIFQFKVLPPWYKTWWAFVLYAFTFFLVMYFVVRWRSWKLEQEKQKLELIINQRTKEIKEKNLQLEEQSEKLKEMDHVKSRFFANISHEFRTPLTLIMGPLEQMLSDCSGKEQQKKLELMLRNSQRLLNLINQLLELSKFDSGKMKLQAFRQNIVPFLRGIAASFEILTAQKQLALVFHSEESDIPLYFDPEKLEKVICNLLVNAVKFTPPGGEIVVTVKVAEKKGFQEISVRDTGVGIPREQLEHIFDRFYQVEDLREHEHKGSGIGLALSKELVVLHHGEINVHSLQGENSGTEFIVRLPMGDAHLKADEIVEPGVPVERSVSTHVREGVQVNVEVDMDNGRTKPEVDANEKENEPGVHEKDIILVVEDSADVRDYIRGALEPLYTIVEAKDGREGIEKARDIIPDLIISDIMMPEKDGYELCRVLKNEINTSHVPIILLTAKAEEENIIKGLETGADDYITKPFNTKILEARIKNLIELRRQLQQNLKREMTLQPVKMSVSKLDIEFLKDLQAVLRKNISDPDFNVEELCKKLYMSRATLYRKINALSGESPQEFIRSYRLKQASELLKQNFGTVLEVAFEVGFSSAAYFTKCFKEKFHQLPSTFQASEAE